jgi:hypothetical protein
MCSKSVRCILISCLLLLLIGCAHRRESMHGSEGGLLLTLTAKVLRHPPLLNLTIENVTSKPVVISLWPSMLPGEVVFRCGSQVYVLQQRKMWQDQMTVTPDIGVARTLRPHQRQVFDLDLASDFITVEEFNSELALFTAETLERREKPVQRWHHKVRCCDTYQIYFVLHNRNAASNVLLLTP